MSRSLSARDSEIGQHFFRNKECAKHYEDKQFSILAKGGTHFQLFVLQATFIEILKPELSRQKEFDYSLNLPHH